MANLSTIEPGFQTLASDGAPVGIVDAVEGGERTRMQPADGSSAATPDLVPSSWVSGVEAELARASREEAEARAAVNAGIPAGDATS